MVNKHFGGGFLLFATLAIAVFWSIVNVSAAGYSWLTSSLYLDEIKTFTMPGDPLDASSITGNKINCLGESFVIKPEIKVLNSVIQNEYRQSVCAYGTSSGMYGNSYLLKNGTKVAGTLKSSTNNYSILIPVPGSSDVIELVSAGGNAYRVYVLSGALNRLTISVDQTTKAVTYRLPAASITDGIKFNSNVLYIDSNTFVLSKNGQWLVADGLNSGFVRIDLATKNVLSFAPNFSTSYNTIYSINAVSDDGTKAIVGALAPYQKSDLYDLSTCVSKAWQVYQACSKRDLQAFFATKRDKFYGVRSVSFLDDYTVNTYASYQRVSTGNEKIGYFGVTSNGLGLSGVNYLALGDSFSSGEGTSRYRPGTDTDLNRCHTSYDSYGYLLRDLMAYRDNTFQSVACSGAKAHDISTKKREDYITVGVQSHGKDEETFDEEIFSNFLPGYRGQINFVEKNKPKIITMSIGGNDIGFAEIIAKCVSPLSSESECYGYYEDRKELVGVINNQYQRLRDAYRDILQASPGVRLYVVGYPQLAKENGDCYSNVLLSNNEIRFSNQLVDYLNSVIKAAADHAGVQYVDVSGALIGHRLCEATKENIAINGLTAGRGGGFIKGMYPFSSASYHPNTLGHQLLANTIAAQTAGLTTPMPTADDSPFSTIADAANPLLQDRPHRSTYALDYMYDSSIASDVIYKDGPFAVKINSDAYSLAPNGSFSLSMYSDPVSLGVITPDDSGNINDNLTLPSSLPVGYHTLHISGKDIIGESIDIAKIVYVGETAGDYDGDGVLNENEVCLGVDAIGVDQDKDGIDDACDGFIDKAPPEPEPTPAPESPADPVQPTTDPQTSPAEDTTLSQETQNPQNQATPENPETPVIINPIPEYKLNDLLPARVSAELQIQPTTPASIISPAQETQPTTSPAPAITTATNSRPITNVAGITDFPGQANDAAQPTKKSWPVLTWPALFVLIVGSAIGAWAFGKKS